MKSLTVATQNQFLVGVAVSGPGESNNILTDISRQNVIKTHFNSIVTGNIMKMSYLHPDQSTFTFTNADAVYHWAHDNSINLHGHALIWHADYQVPSFIKNFSGDAAAWKTMMDDHVTQIAAHFAGKVVSWDVVNEALDDSGSAYRNSIFYQHLGKDFIKNAFIAARAADGTAELYYNDYSIENNGSKTAFLYSMLDELKNANVPITGVGFQMHVGRSFPDIAAIKASFQGVVSRGLKVRISELDIHMSDDNTTDGVANGTMTSLSPGDALLQKQRYKDIVLAYKEVVPVNLRGGITWWGITDNESWLIPFYGSPDWPLLFNSDFSTKLAFDGVIEALQSP